MTWPLPKRKVITGTLESSSAAQQPPAAAATAWTPRPPLNVARGGLTSASLGGKTYAIGGFASGFGDALESVEALRSARFSIAITAPF